MRTNVNNTENKYTRKAIEALKSEIKASAYDEIELTKYGIQIYASYLDSEEYHEYYVVDVARRDVRTGRYYFLTREGVRLAWSRLDINTLIVAAVDFLDAIESEEKRAAETLARLECYGLQHVESRFFFLWVRPLLDTMGTPYRIEATGFNDLGETIDLVRIEDADRVPTWDTIERATDEQLATMKADRIRKAEALHAAAYFIAAVKVSELTGQLSEEQESRRKAAEVADRMESAANDRVKTAAEYLINGANVGEWTLPTRYVVRLSETAAVVVSYAELAEAKDIANKRKAIEADTCESDPRAAFYQLSESKRKAIRYAAHLIATGATVEDRGDYFEVNKTETLARVTIDAADTDHLRHLLTRKAEAGERIAKDCEARELTDAAKVAATRASRCKTIAAPADLLTIEAVELTADTLTADTIATAQTIEGEGEAVEVAESVEGEPQGDTLTTGTPETIEATGEAVESVESPEGDPATTGTTGTPSPTSTPATGGTPSPAAVGTPAPVPAAVALALLLML